MRVSIAMATFNGAKYLQDQLDSFLSQTLRPDELIVCDDCSNDNTIEILEKFKKTVPFDVIVLKNESTLGVSRNFEKAILFCSGDIIFISDQDDVWNVEKINSIVNYFHGDNELQIVINDALIVDEYLIPGEASVLQQTYRLTGSTNEFIHGCCTAFRKTFRDFCFPLPRVGEVVPGFDGWLHTVGVYLGVRVVVPISFQYYRRHQSNVSNSNSYDAKKLNLKDWIAYSFGKFSVFLADNSTHYSFLDNSRLDLILLKKRIGDQSLNLKNIIKDKYLKKLCILENNVNFRIKMAKMPRIKRFYFAAKFYFCGGYENFSGVKSFLIDVLKLKH